MTGDIVQADLELAERLVKENQPDAEIVALLVRRGVSPTAAAQLVADLRSNKPIHLQQLAQGPDLGRRRRSHSSPEAEASPRKESRPRSSSDRHRNDNTWRVLIATAVCVVAIAGGYYFYRNLYDLKTDRLLDQLEASVTQLEKANSSPGAPALAECQATLKQLQARHLPFKDHLPFAQKDRLDALSARVNKLGPRA